MCVLPYAQEELSSELKARLATEIDTNQRCATTQLFLEKCIRFVSSLGQFNHQLSIKMCKQHLDSRCGLLQDPCTFGAAGPNRNTSRIQVL